MLCLVFLHIFVTLFPLMKHTQQGGNGAYQAKSLGLEVRLPSSHVLELGTSQTRSVCGVGVGGALTQAAGYP